MHKMQGSQRAPRGFLTEEEKKNMPKLSRPLIRRIFGYLKPYRLQFLFVFAAILVSSALGLLPSMVVGQIVDRALIGRDMALLIRLVLLAFGTLLASQLVGVVESYLNAWISQHIIYDMKNEMYGHLQSMPHAFFTSQPQGDIITRMNSDIGGVATVISSTLTGIISNIVVVLTTAVALVGMSWQLSLVGILVIPLFILPTREVGRSRWKLLSEGQEKHDKMNSIVSETLSVSGSLLVKLFTREKREMEAFKEVNGDVMKIAMKEQRSGKFFRVMMGMFAEIGPLLIYLAGGWLLITKTDAALTVGAITATVALIGRLYRPIQQLLNIQVDLTRSLALFSRIFDFLDRTVTIQSKENAVCPSLKEATVAFVNVSFGYEEEKMILKDMSFTVPGGKMVAIVGPSGSGKSTIVNLIPRLYDVNEGAVKLNSVDVRDIDLAFLRERVGMVTQDTYLFNGTVRENLMLAKEDATQEEIENACKIANIYELIMSQPLGYDAMVGNRGLKMSGGEKQRISIARTILKDPDILILDEATSALDSILESAIQAALEGLMKKRTSIVIAHRLSTILSADCILVIKDGQVVEEGTHEELLSKEGLYRELYETQFQKDEDDNNQGGV